MSRRGFTLVEMLVVLGILGVLAAVTIPFAETAVKRDKEMELRRNLREIRVALDRFHSDWEAGTLSPLDRSVSPDGYPRKLSTLTEGVETTGPRRVKRKYLRRIPRNPFADPVLPREEQWSLRSYPDAKDAAEWGGQDVYDVRSPVEGKALDGSRYEEW